MCSTRPDGKSCLTFGRGAMTNHGTDIKNADLVLTMGGNAAEAYPCGFKWVTEPKRTTKRGCWWSIRVSPVPPRSPNYAPIRPAPHRLLGGLINYLLENDKIQHEYVRNCHRCLVHREGRLQLRGRPVQRLRCREADLPGQVLLKRDR